VPRRQPPEDRGQVFDRFFRGKGPHASGAAAGGLGLSVVRWVARLHGGEVRLLDGEGPGATFEVVLPRPTNAGSLLTHSS
jgi:signal transduction histidine kinase